RHRDGRRARRKTRCGWCRTSGETSAFLGGVTVGRPASPVASKKVTEGSRPCHAHSTRNNESGGEEATPQRFLLLSDGDRPCYTTVISGRPRRSGARGWSWSTPPRRARSPPRSR